MCAWWLAYGILGIGPLFIIVLGCQANIAPRFKTPVAKTLRPLTPRTSEDCPLYRRPQPAPLFGQARRGAHRRGIINPAPRRWQRV